MKRDPIIAALMADPHVADAFKAVFHEDYTPEEIAIEAEERAQAEERQADMDRSEGFYERGLWEAYDAPTGGRL
jgi:hypothetical protein